MLYCYLCKKGVWDTVLVTYFTKAEHQVTAGLQKAAFFSVFSWAAWAILAFLMEKPTSRFIFFLNQDTVYIFS